MAKKPDIRTRPGAPTKDPEDRTNEKAVLLLTRAQMEKLKEVSFETNLSVSAILREALAEKYPKIFK